MGSSKPGLFGRIKNAISGTLGDAVDSISDPGRELALMLDDLETQIKEAEKDMKTAMIEAKVMERKIEEKRKDEENWEAKAEQALKLGDEKLARAALERKTELSGERKDAEDALDQQKNLVEDMREQIKESKAKLKSLNLRRGSLMAQARAAKHGEDSAAAVGIAATAKIDEIEDKIAELEAFNEVAEETRSVKKKEAEIDRKLRELEGTDEVDDELEALKAKMRAKGAITDGSEKKK
jgi:phage shock protein A